MATAINQEKLADADRENLIARLRKEKEAMLKDIREEGFRLGVESARNFSYQDFQELEQHSKLGVKLEEEAIADLWKFLDIHNYPQDIRFHKFGLTHLLSLNADHKSEFVQGWLAGVMSVWRDLQPDLNS